MATGKKAPRKPQEATPLLVRYREGAAQETGERPRFRAGDAQGRPSPIGALAFRRIC